MAIFHSKQFQKSVIITFPYLAQSNSDSTPCHIMSSDKSTILYLYGMFVNWADSAGTYEAEPDGDAFYNNQFINIIIY